MSKNEFELGGNERERERAIRIAFGTIHTYSRDPRLKYVILDVGEDSWFTASQILNKGRLGIPGTGSLSDIEDIVGIMDVDEVLKGLTMTIGSMSLAIESDIRHLASKASRILKK